MPFVLSFLQGSHCFQLIKTVLDELYVHIPGKDEQEKDFRIQRAIIYLCDRYQNLLNDREPIDYRDPVIRFAYIYKYVPFHANIIFNVINHSPELQSLFDFDKVKITCIGGGPGSDLLGILKYLMNTQKHPTINFTLFDREEAWGESWEDIGVKVDPEFRIYENFQQFDVTNTDTWSQKSKYLNSNLFTMMYFMSEVYSLRNEATPFFDHLFSNMPTNSYILFVDNNSDQFISWFDKLTDNNDVCPIYKETKVMKFEDQDEQKSDLGIYYQKFGGIDKCRPKLTANIVYQVCQKICV